MNKYEILLQGLLLVWKRLNNSSQEVVEMNEDELQGYNNSLVIFRESALEVLIKEAQIVYPTISAEMLQWNIVQIFNMSK